MYDDCCERIETMFLYCIGVNWRTQLVCSIW